MNIEHFFEQTAEIYIFHNKKIDHRNIDVDIEVKISAYSFFVKLSATKFTERFMRK